MIQPTQHAPSSARLIKSLVLETFTLFLATLIFYVLVLPSMIRLAVSSNVPRAPDQYVWVSLVNDGSDLPAIGNEIGLYVRDELGNISHCFELDHAGSNQLVTWGRLAAPRYSFRIATSQPLHLGLWWARSDPKVALRDVKVIVYADAEASAIQEALNVGVLPAGYPTVELTKANGFQQEIPLPAELMEAQ